MGRLTPAREAICQHGNLLLVSIDSKFINVEKEGTCDINSSLHSNFFLSRPAVDLAGSGVVKEHQQQNWRSLPPWLIDDLVLQTSQLVMHFQLPLSM